MDFLNNLYYGNTISQWLIALGIMVAAFVAARILYWIFGHWFMALAKRTKGKWDEVLIDLLEEPIVAFVVLWSIRFAIGTLTLSEQAELFLENAYLAGLVLIVAWFFIRIYDAFHKSYLTRLVSKTKSDLDDQLLPVIRSSVRFLIISLAIIIGLNNAGYDVGAILAGFGIGGLAFALAAQDTVANLFGGITIFLQRPFKVGDLITAGGVQGYVRAIGLRSSRLEFVDGESYWMPNKIFIEGVLTNKSTRTYLFQSEVFHLHRDTPVAKLELALQKLPEAFQSDPNVVWAMASLIRASEYAFEIQVDYGIQPWQTGDGFAHHLHKMTVTRSNVNLAAIKLLSDTSIKLAVPVLWATPQVKSTGIYASEK